MKSKVIPTTDFGTTELDQNNQDLFHQLIEVYYFPFLKKYHSYILIVWLLLFIVSAIFGNFYSTRILKTYIYMYKPKDQSSHP